MNINKIVEIETKHKFYGDRKAKEWIEVTTRNGYSYGPVSIVYNYEDYTQSIQIPHEMVRSLAQALTMVTPKVKGNT